MVLPTSSTPKMLLAALAAVVGLVVIVGGVLAFNGSDEPIAEDRTASPSAPSVAEPTAPAPPATPVASAVAAAPVAPAPAAPPPAQLAEPTPAAAVAPAPPPAPVAPPPPRTARLRVRTVPASATLTVDDHPVSNPYEAELPVDSRHTIEASAEGYRAASRSVRLAHAEDITLTLAAQPAPRPPQQHASSAARTHERSSARPAQSRGASRPRSTGGAGFVTDNPY